MKRTIHFSDGEKYKCSNTDWLFIKNTTVSIFTDNEYLRNKYRAYIWGDDPITNQVNIILPEHMIDKISVKSTL